MTMVKASTATTRIVSARLAGGVAGATVGDLELHQFLDELWFVGADACDDGVDFFVADVRALAAQEHAGAGGEEEHVAVAQQLVGPHFVEHDTAVGAAGHLDQGREK